MTVKRATSEPVIGTGTVVRGKLVGDEDLLVLGRVEGELDLGRGTLRLERSGVLVADVRAAEAQIAGVVVGRLVVSGLLALLPTARVLGDVTAGRLVVEAGAQVRGEVEAGELPRGAVVASTEGSTRPFFDAALEPSLEADRGDYCLAVSDSEAPERRRVAVRVKRSAP